MFRLLILLLAILGGGCSITNNSRHFISIAVKPSDARVIVNGVEYPGDFPQFVEICDPSRQLLISAFHPDYHKKLYVVDSKLSGAGKIDAWSSFLLFPMLGLLSDGAWELEERNINLVLEPKNDLQNKK